VDDDHFNLDYHFRHTSLPRPGMDEQLKRLTARLMEPLSIGRARCGRPGSWKGSRRIASPSSTRSITA
jgi:hypothetical protein